MAKKRFWKGFAAGAAAGAGAGFGSWVLSALLHRRHAPIIRLEKSIQIGRPIDDVFRAWSDFEHLPSLLPMIEEVSVRGNRSHWRVRLNGKVAEWDAKVTQSIPNQALGWKSVSGPKHTGRINFSPLNSDTEVHMVMNYAPPLGAVGAEIAAQTALLEDYLARALREFKASLEGKGQERVQAAPSQRRTRSGGSGRQEQRATGTAGPEAGLSGHTQTSQFGGVPEQG